MNLKGTSDELVTFLFISIILYELFRSFLIEEKCRFLSNFSLQTAEVELPGEFLLPKVY